MMITPVFPKDYKCSGIGDSRQWTFKLSENVKPFNVSVLIETKNKDLYEMWDYRENRPRRNLTIEDINDHFMQCSL